MTSKAGSNAPESRSGILAIHGGTPVRSTPLPLEFPGVHHMDDEEIDAAVRVLRSRSPFRYYGIDLQREVESFEAEFAQYLGIDHCLAVNSGTGALHLALSALGVGPGQEVIVPAYMWVSVVAAVVNLGAIPVLADIDETFGVDPESVAAKIGPRTAGVIVVHMSGTPVNVQEVAKIARERGIFLLEDCAQCAGGSIGGQKVGTFGDMAIFSFQMNKNMTSGEGGAVVTRHEHLFHRAVACHDTGYARDAAGRAMFERRDLCLWGRGYRLDEMRAAILRVQLRKLPRIIEQMHGSKYRIRKALEQLPEIRLRRIVDEAGDTGCFLLTTFATAEMARELNQALRAEGIITSSQGVNNVVMTEWGLHIYYNIPSLVLKTSIDKNNFPWGLSENRECRAEYGKGTCPQADSLFERTILIAIPSCLSPQDEDDIVGAFRKVLAAVPA
ncbi:DegT/DnrJ/EryC1/StrS family aminotransferase [Occallatibacter riparius]|uniref:DegT/DnrJ/EryC1/StrS family aminotransferase n=1 Tax=Occallatibacter riparius TaxID=1002689 RepID=A0A9J7BVL0_9BACT|nr:DegT/DnrJ/EryC1/StrS family aminotransferase [Occallatibacter riparius]UWZ85826.1 DegT/DnrJ/EryC1/StrS family aminotransferase [Occallatibacter riparius]